MELEIVKAEEGLCGGRVLYHQHVHKSAAEVDKQTRTIQSQQELKEKRKRQQVHSPPACGVSPSLFLVLETVAVKPKPQLAHPPPKP